MNYRFDGETTEQLVQPDDIRCQLKKKKDLFIIYIYIAHISPFDLLFLPRA